MGAKQHVGKCVENADEAAQRLRYFDGRVFNGYGEFSDPSFAYSMLRDAKREIEAALQELAAAERCGWTRGDDD